MPNKTSRIMNSKGGLSGFHKLVSGHPQGLLVAVHFWADWAEQCAPMDEVIKILSQDDEFNQVLFVRVEAEEEAEVAMEYEVAAVPTFIFFGRVSDGKKIRVIDRIEGAKVADVTKKVKELSSKLKLEHRTAILNEKNAALDVAEKQESSEDLNTRLKRLINAAPAMLFMKGSPAAPECGFSRQTVQMLNEINAEYGHFDILRDQEVRQGLKEYSKWPTYPQLYVKGELIGGLDILKEMHENGELESLLPKKQNLNERLGFLVNQSPVMIFMKGDRSEPKCGFSRQLVEMMKEYPKVNYKTFDILKDEEVRQGLKTYSNWPTYPQVYVKGKLIGGLDIIKELKEEDELESTLTA